MGTSVTQKKGEFTHISSGISYQPEDNPFNTILADITHRCNMKCRNCYIPNRHIPDMDEQWLYGILERLPKRVRVRLVGAEPTLRKDLPNIISRIRKLGHNPVVMSNGLKLVDKDYVLTLKKAGMRTIYLSMNGGTDDDIYDYIDKKRCAKEKIQALDNLCEARMNITTGMIVSSELGSDHVDGFYNLMRSKSQVREFHLRNIGPMGRYIKEEKLSMEGLIDIASTMTGMSHVEIKGNQRNGSHHIDFRHDGMNIQLTDWPDLGDPDRGRLTPDGTIEPCFENLIANEGGY